MFRCSGVPVLRCSGVPVFRCSGVLVFQGVPVFLVLVHALINLLRKKSAVWILPLVCKLVLKELVTCFKCMVWKLF